MPVEGVLGQRGQFGEQFLALLDGERGRDTDVVHHPVVVEQSQEHRADAFAVLVDAVSGQRTVRRALVLDLDQGPLVRLVLVVEPLGDDAVESGAFERREPLVGHCGVLARRRDEHARTGLDDVDQLGSALAERPAEPRLVTEGEEVEGDEDGRRLGGEPVDPRHRRVDPLQQGVEVEPAATGVRDDDLAIDDDVVGECCGEHREQLREVPGERSFAAAGQLDVVTVAAHDAAEPVPLRLEQPPVALGNRP